MIVTGASGARRWIEIVYVSEAPDSAVTMSVTVFPPTLSAYSPVPETLATALSGEGVTVMRSAMEPLLQSPLLRLELARVQQSPLHGLLAGVCMTLTVQSSSATVALLQSMAAQPGADGVHSLLGLTAAIPILLGDNIGTTVTAVLAAIGQGRDAKRVAAAHAIFNLSGAAVRKNRAER